MLVFKNANVFCENEFRKKIICVEDSKISHIFSQNDYDEFKAKLIKQDSYNVIESSILDSKNSKYNNSEFIESSKKDSKNTESKHYKNHNLDSKKLENIESKDYQNTNIDCHDLPNKFAKSRNDAKTFADSKNSKNHNFIESKHTIFEINCENLCIIPSCIDINIFPLDKKMNAKTIHTLSQKALNGGVSTLFLNPYTTPAINNEAMIALLQSINNNELVNIFSLIPSTIAPENIEAIKNTINSSDKLSNIDTLYALNKDFNNISSAIFCNSYIGSNLLYQAMQYAKMLNVPLCAFPFDFNIEQGVAYESAFARGLGLPMITPIGQIKEVAKIKEMAKFLDLKVILMSLNIAYCFDMVCHERNIFTQVGLPHLIFSERDIKNYDTRYKIMPPLLTRSKKEKLLKKLIEGKISLLSSMQNAVSKQFKEQVFEFAPFSVEGLEGFFSIAYTHLVRSGLITLSHLLELVSGNASDLMGLNKGRLEANSDADFMIIDLDSKYVINNPLSPYHNMEVYGILHNVVINGEICDVNRI